MKIIITRTRPIFLAILLLPMAASIAVAQQKNIAERLGYPADAKLVILHADDLGVAHSVDMASFTALDQKAVSSASVMVPCPWLTEVAAYAKAHPDADLGLHLTLTSEWKTYRWGPVAPKDQVPSLLAPDGYFYPDTGPVASHATPEEVEREIRAQIELAMKMGIHPTHLDIHMGTLAARPEFYAVLVKVAHEYKLPFLAVRVPDAREKMMESLLSPKDVVLDSLVMFDARIQPDHWTESYVAALKAIKPGVHYMIVHLGHDDAELQAITVGHPDYGAAWRQRDFNAVTSPEFKKALQDNHIILIGWKDLKKLM
ncbi:MAG: polysaccharide deacetylase family protein [Terriglobia bacterium]